jgi:outer membrane protein OmpA-like peptidoglycan-associated protein
MASIMAHKVGLAALVAAGLLDLALINVAIGPRALSEPTRAPALQVAVLAPPARLALPAPPRPRAAPVPVAPPAPPAPVPPAIAPAGAARPAAATPAPKILHMYFGSRSTRLSTRTRAVLDQAARRAGATAMIELEGHSDRVGDETYNRELGRDRAEAAADYLVTRGIAVERITHAQRGKLGAADTPDSELWHDRRVDVRIIEGGIK